MANDILIGGKEYFKGISKIKYEGKDSKNPLAFKFYDEDKIVAGKTMKEHFQFAVAYWHSFCGTGADPFGLGTKQLPWNSNNNPVEAAKDKLDAAFEFMTKLGIPYYCFHDRDIAPEGETFSESDKILKEIVALAKEKQDASGVKLFWGTASLFTHPRYMNGAATNPDFNVLTYAAAQVKSALEATVELNGKSYLFWGGREGYLSLLNTNMKRSWNTLECF